MSRHFAGFMFDRRVEQVEVAEGVLHFLRGGFLEHFGGLDVALRAADFREVHVLDVRHRFAGEGGFDVLDGDGFGFHAVSFVKSLRVWITHETHVRSGADRLIQLIVNI